MQVQIASRPWFKIETKLKYSYYKTEYKTTKAVEMPYLEGGIQLPLQQLLAAPVVVGDVDEDECEHECAHVYERGTRVKYQPFVTSPSTIDDKNIDNIA